VLEEREPFVGRHEADRALGESEELVATVGRHRVTKV
jgi:hypothetical protein